MSFIPNYADASHEDQAEVDAKDFDILLAGVKRTGVVSGCAVTAQASPDMTVAVASGTVVVDGTEASVTSGNVTVTASHATLPRFDLIVSNSSGTKSCTAGTPASNPVFPTIPASSVVLAAVYVGANVSTIPSTKIVDKRVFVQAGDASSAIKSPRSLGTSSTQAAAGNHAHAHTDLTGVSSDQHHNKSHAHDGADGSGTVAHSATTGKTANDHHNQVHTLDGSDHTVSGLTTGHVLRATGASTFAFGAAPASTITNTPAGNIAATTVQAAIDELDSEKAAATDPMGLGFPRSGSMRYTQGAAIIASATNRCTQVLAEGAGSAGKIRCRVGTASGNIGLAVYAASGSGLSKTVGARSQTTGAVSCPAAGDADVSLGGSVSMTHRAHWFGVSADNTTATLFVLSTQNVVPTSLGAGETAYITSAAHPPPDPGTPTDYAITRVPAVLGVP